MTEIVKVGTVALVSPIGLDTPRLEGAPAGEVLGAFDACYIKSTDGRVYRSLNGPQPTTGSSSQVSQQTVHGYVTAAASPGDRVTLIFGVQAAYGAGLTATTPLYLSGTVPGGLTDVAPTPGAPAIARAVSATTIECAWLAGVRF